MTYMGRVQKNLSDHNLYKTHVSSGLKSMPNPELNCKENFVKCSNESHCIPKFLWCNGKIDCADASDEEMCSCLDKIDEEKICDGSFDCFNGEDELNCFGNYFLDIFDRNLNIKMINKRIYFLFF